MYDIEQLEQRWKRYRRKRLWIPTVFALVLLSIFISVPYLFSTAQMKTGQNAHLAQKGHLTKSQEEKKPKKSKLHGLATETPSLKVEKKTQVGKIIFNGSDEVPVKHKRKNLLIQITERSKGALPQDIEKRFSYNKDVNDALFLAKYYYDKRAYKKSEKWALEANKLDSKLEESWLIFAKSKAKRGQRIEALKVLQTYYNESQSEKARMLIDKIRRGHDF